MNPKTTILLLGASLLIYFFYYRPYANRDEKLERRYFDQLHLKLKAVVETVDNPASSNGFGIIKTRIIESNLTRHDPRNDYNHFYCYINNGEAEFYQLGVGLCNVGDTIDVNTDNRIFIIYKPDMDIKQPIVLYTNDRFYNYVKRNHQKF